MVRWRTRVCPWLLLLAEVALASLPSAVRANEAGPLSNAAIFDALERADVPLYLEASVNGRPAGLARFTLRGMELWAASSTLLDLGLGVDGDAHSLVRLADIAGLAFKYDAAGQRLEMIAPLSLLAQGTSYVGQEQIDAAPPSSEAGVLYNYSAFGGIQGTSRTVGLFSEMRAFHQVATASSTFLSQAQSQDGGWTVRSVRLDSNVTVSFPARMLTVTAGDSFTAATAWSRVSRFAGIQLGTDFTLQPYLATTPLTQYFGEAALPSTIELYVDGLKQATGEVPPGPFQISAPTGSGAGAGSGAVVITDALGQVRTLAFDLYHAPTLLRRGLTGWTAEAGFLRRDYGLRSFAYARDPFASGTLRHGLSNRLTLETHGELTAGLAVGGAGASWRIGQLGVVSGSVSASSGVGRSGTKYTLGYAWSNDTTSLSFDLAKTSSRFRDLPSLEGSPLPRQAISVQASHSAGRFGTFGISYVDLDHRRQPRSRYLGAHWSASLGRRLGLTVQATQGLERRRNRTLFAGINLRLGQRQVTASVQRERRAHFAGVEAMRSIPETGGLGWRAQVQQAGNRTSGAGEIQVLHDSGQLMAGGRIADGSLSAYAGASGAVVLIDGSVFAARQIHDSFAVVSTGGLADVPVRLRNNLVGKTGRHGKLLVSNLNAYENNVIEIDVANLPADVRIGKVEAAVKPADRGGSVVAFDLAKVRAAVVRLVDETGQAIPVGSAASLRGGERSDAVVGFDGEVYLEALGTSNVVDVALPGGRCTARFDLSPAASGISRLGPVVCSSGRLAHD